MFQQNKAPRTLSQTDPEDETALQRLFYNPS